MVSRTDGAPWILRKQNWPPRGEKEENRTVRDFELGRKLNGLVNLDYATRGSFVLE